MVMNSTTVYTYKLGKPLSEKDKKQIIKMIKAETINVHLLEKKVSTEENSITIKIVLPL